MENEESHFLKCVEWLTPCFPPLYFLRSSFPAQSRSLCLVFQAALPYVAYNKLNFRIVLIITETVRQSSPREQHRMDNNRWHILINEVGFVSFCTLSRRSQKPPEHALWGNAFPTRTSSCDQIIEFQICREVWEAKISWTRRVRMRLWSSEQEGQMHLCCEKDSHIC